MIGKDYFDRKAEIVARDLLGKILVRKLNNKELKARIVEVEAYYDDKDPASRACKNGDLRETMKMPGGTILVYGCHNNWLINFITGKENEAEAVLLRALEPLNFTGNTKGPGLLTKCLGIDKSFHKKEIGRDLWLEDGERVEIKSSKRIGVREDLARDLRFFIKDNIFVSK